MKERQSFGLICIDPQNKKILCVQRKDTPELRSFIRGATCSEKDLEYIIKRSTNEEHRFILNVLDSRNRVPLLTEYIGQRYSEGKVKHCLQRSLKNFDKFEIHIRSLLNQIQEYKDYEWIWPEGGIEEGEEPVSCAIRETQEETGFLFSPNEVDTRKIYTIEIDTFFGLKLVHKHYVALVDSEAPRIQRRPDPKEIRNVAWISFDDFPSIIKNHIYVIIFNEIIKDYNL